MSRGTRWLPLVLVGLWVGLDFALKGWSLGHLEPGHPQPLAPGVLSLALGFNPGAAWGLLSGQTGLLVLVRLGVGLALLGYLAWKAPPPAAGVALSLIAGGALGNGLDQLVDGTVVDMLYSHTLSVLTRSLYGQDYPVFNLADVWLVSGVVLLLVPRARPVRWKEDRHGR
ncbi:Lipoprotein signal peptidase [Calidithermus terrae]|jgi:signal peptidase II|uniref:Lipoprotein signal peptidase n=3 Tax=Thermaceae TaxID=188786 RepID=A0A511QYY7_9DEIN|nr:MULTISPECIES: signal peptidase II [Thermaceae]RIH76942.1 Lipoprotein signal peptidase [Calidithermus terrae]RIH80409.1 Lipoprotein signal peptidase [Meiothermus hypogaeus]GEM82604.1 lipoprotein signal peptidase [Meiothermus hypogaeus NBRC 106114]GIW32642.1 MAG: lipoprotein signal peptidase [Meiothermus sp.]